MPIHAPNEQLPFQKYDITMEHDPSVDAFALKFPWPYFFANH